MDPNKPVGLSDDKPTGLSSDKPTGLSNDKPGGLSNDNQSLPADSGNPTENLASLSGDANPLTGGGSNPQSVETKPNDFSGTESGSVNPEMPQPLNTSAQTPTMMPMGDPIPPAGGNNNSGLPNVAGVSKAGGSSHKVMMAIIILLVVAILGVGGYYFYTTQTGSKEEMTQNQTTSQTEQDLTGLETELESVQVTDPEGDFMEVDKEITLLEATPAGRTSPGR